MMNWLATIHFDNPDLLYLLLLIPLLIVWYVFRESQLRASVSFSETGMFAGAGTSPRIVLRHLLFALRQLALALLIVALARPQTSSSGKNITVEGIDIVLSLDVSGSMLARDLKPDRIEASKAIAADFIKGRPNDRMGLVIFSGETFTQVPLTTDHNVILNMFKDIKSGMIEDGTAIGDGLATAVGRLRESDAISKVVILLTDGMNNAGSVDPMTAAEIARVFGVRVYTIGVGSYGTAPYPVQTPFGTRIVELEADIDDQLLQQIAEHTGGKYYRATSNKKLEEVYQEIDKLERSKIDVTEFRSNYDEYFPLAMLAFLFLLIEFVLRHTVFRSIT